MKMIRGPSCHLVHLEEILSQEKIEELRKEVVYNVMNRDPEFFKDNVFDLSPKDIIPTNIHFIVRVRKMLKKRKPRATKEEMAVRNFFKPFRWFEL